MIVVDEQALTHADAVLGLDLSLTGPGIAAISEPWFPGDVPLMKATTLSRVPTTSRARGQVMADAAERIARAARDMVPRALYPIAVAEALLLQSGTGKAPERAAFWWMVRAELERMGVPVVSVHPTSRRSIVMDDAARAELNAMPKAERTKRGKAVGLESARRRYPAIVLADDNAADALVCAEVGARAVGWEGFPDLGDAQKKSMSNAISALGIERKDT